MAEIAPGLNELGTGEDKDCRDEECGGRAEVEVDGEIRYWVCEECGFEFDYEKVEAPSLQDSSCGIGVPESIRRAASAGMAGALADEQKRQPIPISIGRRLE